MNTLRLYRKSMAMLIRSHLQYPASFLMQTIAQLVMEGGEMMAVILLVNRFDHLNQWEPGNLYFFFGLMSVSFYITECFGRGVTGTFPSMVRTGHLDTLLLRPRGVLTQVLCGDADPRRIACIAVGTVSLVLGSRMSGIVKSVELANALTYGGRSACQYPIDTYPRPLRVLFTVVAPFALVMHVPAAQILDKPLFGWPAWIAYVTPLAGLVLFGVMYVLFRKALKFYRSTGS